MTPEEETALRSQVAQLRAALMSVYVSHQELHSNPVLTETIEEPAWAALDATADSEKWLAEHDAKLLVAGRMENRSAAYRILGEPEQADFSSALAAHDTRVRAEARRAALEEAAKHFESHEFLNVDGADVAEELRALKEKS